MNIRTIMLGTAACAMMAGTAFAQDQSVQTVGSAGATPAPKHHHHTAPSTGSDRLELLERQVEQQQQEIQDLKAQMGGGGQVSSAQFEALQNQVYETQATVKSATANQGSVRFNHSHLTISSPDGKYSFSPIVDVMGDWAAYSKRTVAGIGLKAAGENFRRAQIGFQGTFAGDFSYKFVYDFGGTNGDETYQAFQSKPPSGTALNVSSTGAGTGPHIKEAWVGYKGILDPFTFKLGAMPTPSNLADMTSSDDLLFNERPSPAQISRATAADDGRESVGFVGNGSWWQGSAFLTGDTYGKGDLIAPGSGQEAFVGRAAIAPFYDPATNFNVHLGVNFTDVIRPQQSTAVNSAGTALATTHGISFSDRPELRVDNVTFLKTPTFDANGAYVAGAELAGSWGPLMVQSEYFRYNVDLRNPAAGVTNPNFDGWYVEGSWVMTGEFRKYNMATASYTRPSPANPFDPLNGNWGAWELAGRYSSTDLNYDTTSAVAANRVFGGKQDIVSGGVNFYPNDTLKFMLDYQDVTVHNVGSAHNNGSYNAISMRAQVTF